MTEANVQTWTRKENAIKAVKKLMAEGGVDYPSSDVEAVEHANGGFYVKVTSKPAHFKQTGVVLEGKALFALKDWSDGQEPVAEEPVAETEKPAKKASNKGGRKVFLNGDKNPFRAGNGSWKTFEHVRTNPGITFNELKEAKGIRMRAVSHCLQMGWFKVED